MKQNCGCCSGVEVVTPQPEANRPGLPAISYRAGTYATFFESMVARLSSFAELRGLTTRESSDPSIALLDAWAVVADVLTFYQERIANEHYLRTATERRSVLELARAIGYELAPGVSASTSLAFELETAATAPRSAMVPAGTKVQSIPAKDEKPQLYETSAALVARGAWNEIPVRWRGTRLPRAGGNDVFLAGVSTGLVPGDALLLVGKERIDSATSDRWDFRRVLRVEPVADPRDVARSYTRIEFDGPLGRTPAQVDVRVYGLRQRVGLFGGNAPDFNLLPKTVRDEIKDAAAAVTVETRKSKPDTRGVDEFRIDRRAGEFGKLGAPDEWPNFNIGYSASTPATLDTLFLDNVYTAAMKGTWLVVTTDDAPEELYRIEAASESGKACFAVSGKSMRVRLRGKTDALVSKTFWNKLREIAVFLQTEEYTLAERPVSTALATGNETLDLEVALTGDDALPPGRTLIVSGEDPSTGAAVAEVVSLVASSPLSEAGADPRTRLTLATRLTRSYRPRSAVVLANVVEATHGETMLRKLPNGSFVTEVLGSGDGSLPFQKFVLKQKPLTYVSAVTMSGRASTLRIRVDGVLWREVPSFYGVGPDERVYIVRLDDDGKVAVQFGNGRTGARLPTGSENVTAVYRVGTGLEGLVDAGQLTLLMSRPLGVKEVRNPLASSGADDPERLADARANAPLTVLTLDRVVSLLDYEDFARAFAGIGKASVTLLWTGQTQTIHVTVALADGRAPDETSRTMTDLRGAVDKARHNLRSVLVQGYVGKPFRVTAKIAVDPAHETDVVLRAVTDALLAHFAFAKRSFAQDVTESEAIAVMQSVKGVVFVDLDVLNLVVGGTAVGGRLEASPARLEGTTVRAAELLTLAAADIHLTARAP